MTFGLVSGLALSVWVPGLAGCNGRELVVGGGDAAGDDAATESASSGEPTEDTGGDGDVGDGDVGDGDAGDGDMGDGDMGDGDAGDGDATSDGMDSGDGDGGDADATSEGSGSGDGDGGDGDGTDSGDGDSGDGDGDGDRCSDASIEVGEFCDEGIAGDCSHCLVSNTGPAGSVVFWGEAGGDDAGWSVSSAGDVDGDGLHDVLIGAPRASGAGGEEGKSYLVLGAAIVAAGDGATFPLANASYRFVGEAFGDESGSSVASAGDVDGDGKDDLLIGAPYNSEGEDPTTNTTRAGKTYLMLGADITAQPVGHTFALGTDASYSFVGEVQGDWSGSSVASAGDVDGDGKDDVLIGAPYNSSGGFGVGKTYLMLGADITAQVPGSAGSRFLLSAASYSFEGEESNEASGCSVSSAGDVDGDGKDDVLIGARLADVGEYQRGKAYLMLGAAITATPPGSPQSTVDLALASYRFVGEMTQNNLGVSVAGAGDVDADGKDDVLLGAANHDGGSPDMNDNRGKAYLMLGADLSAQSPGTPGATFDVSTASYSFQGVAPGDQSGRSVSSAGDVDGDGRDDVLIGARLVDGDNGGSNDNRGEAYLMLGATVAAQTPGTSGAAFSLALHATATFQGVGAGDQAGLSVASAGDVNGDGKADLLIGAPHTVNDPATLEQGRTYLILSPY